MQTVSAIIYIALLGLAAHLVGEALPRRWFRFDRGLYRCRAWERGGAVYERFSIHRWKLLLPDKSRYARGMVKKQLGMPPSCFLTMPRAYRLLSGRSSFQRWMENRS